MTAKTAVQKLTDPFADWLKYSRELNGELNELYEMNRVLGDMERFCALCPHKRRCDEDLAAGTSLEHYQEYCPIAPAIKRLLRVDPLTVKFLAATNRKM
jgi:hypothetical protein